MELSKIAHRDAEVLEVIHEVAPDSKAHHARTKLRFPRKPHFRFTPKADVGAQCEIGRFGLSAEAELGSTRRLPDASPPQQISRSAQ